MSEVYNNPKYYEIAFGFRDIKKEVDIIEDCIGKYSDIPVESVLEIASGNSPHMVELIGRGYHYTGIDLSEEMLRFSREKASDAGLEVSLVRADMVDFSLAERADFVYIMLGSLELRNTKELVSHFDSVARALKTGGLYFLDWCVCYETPFETEGGDSWEMKADGIRVKTTISWKAVSRIEQTFEETLVFDVDDHGRTVRIDGTSIKRAIYPQEFLFFISDRTDFEFIGWWNHWNLKRPLETDSDKINRPIALIKRV